MLALQGAVLAVGGAGLPSATVALGWVPFTEQVISELGLTAEGVLPVGKEEGEGQGPAWARAWRDEGALRQRSRLGRHVRTSL